MAITETTTPAPTRLPAAVPDEPIFRLSLAQYRAMAELGILTEEDPVELLEGWLVQKMTKDPPHTVACHLMQEALRRSRTSRSCVARYATTSIVTQAHPTWPS